MSAAQPSTDAANRPQQNAPNQQQNMGGAPPEMPPGLPLSGLAPDQLAGILRNLPNMFHKLAEEGTLKEAAATLSNLSQAAYPGGPPHPHLGHFPPPHLGHHGLPMEPGPSSHPRGPPNLGQLSAAASGALPMQAPEGQQQQQQQPIEGQENDEEEGGEDGAGAIGPDGQPSATAGGRSRSGRSATMSNDEWTRQRKDNHKEVERRRRGNINDGINELGRIVPNGTGEKAKGAILQRAVQYIHHLKENEARNIEKWTLEKLLMDQAMGDLQAQLEEMRRMWEEERNARLRAENELEVLRGVTGHAAPGQMAGAPATAPKVEKDGGKRKADEGENMTGAEKEAKKQRVE